MSYPIPEHETERLHTLRGYGILDTHPEDRFDELTWLAATICRTPMSLISLVDEDRQWFKSKIGLETCQTARRDAFCAHAIMSPEVFIVPDAKQDSRFADNPLVLGEPHIRFYAGAPLTAPNGHHLGALCVIDRIPRRLSDEQLQALRILSRQVVAQLVLGKQLQDLRGALHSRDELEADMEKLVEDLVQANARIRKLTELIPVCAWCKKVRDDRGFWEQVEAYITSLTGGETTSAICPECLEKNLQELRQTGSEKGLSHGGSTKQ